jgi:predicted negative regulator of RcsB-dependent stress response
MPDRDDMMDPDDQQFTVTTTIVLYAKDAKQAAMKAFALHDTVTPEDYQVADAASMRKDVFLEDEDKEEARRAYRAGEYFKEINLGEIGK